VASPISGDKILAQYDVKTARADDKRAAAGKPEDAQNRPQAAAQDSVELKNDFSGEATRPLSERIGEGKQARASLDALLQAMRNNPAQAAAAHAAVSQNSADLALKAPPN